MQKGALFKTVRVVVVLSIAMIIAVVLLQLRPRAEKQARTSDGRLVEIVRTHAQSLPMIVEAYGTVQARKALKLVAEVRGRVAAMHPAFIEGAYVKAGEVLLTIDPRDYELAVRRAEVGIRQARAELDRLEQDIINLNASLKLARSDVDLALAEADRLRKLVGMDVATQSVLDQADRQYLSSRERMQALENELALTRPGRVRLESNLDMAKVALEQAALDLERCRIKAPFDAWVTEKAVETGQHLSVGQPVGNIYQAGAFDIEVKIPVQDLAWFPEEDGGQEGPPAEVLFMETVKPKLWHGRVARVKAALDPTTRTLPVVVEVDLPAASDSQAHSAGRMKPGMFVTVKIKGRQVENVHQLPRHLVHDGDTVYLAKGGRLEIRPVTVLRRFKETVLISQGLSDADRVITSPISGAVEGMGVRVED